MNKIYRVVWNASTGMWSAASEQAKGRRKSRSRSAFGVGLVLAIAFGGAGLACNARASGVALGDNARAPLDSATAVGIGAEATDQGSSALGYYAKATGSTATAVGFGAEVTGDDSAAMGAFARATASNTTAAGVGAQAMNNGASAIGGWSQATGLTSSAVGYYSKATADNAVALGAYSVADRANTVSVGTTLAQRQITNVAAGTENTDAVNVSQLKTVDGKVAALADTAIQYDDSTRNSITLGGDTYNSSTRTGGTKITNVARGEADSDAVNMSQLNETKASISNLGDSITNITGDTSDTYVTQNGRGIKYARTNDAGLMPGDAFAQGQGSTALGYGATTTTAATNALALGNGASVSFANSVALGAGSRADGTTLGQEAYKVGGTANGEVNIGDRRITGLAAGATDTDAVNVAQLKAVDGKVAALADNAVQYDDSTHSSITLGGSDGTTIRNVAAGTNGTDAVNVNQLNEAVSNITNTASNASNPFVAADGNRDTDGAVASGTQATAIGANANGSGANSAALGAGSNASAANSVALGANSVAERTNSVSVGSAGNERQITNVAAGTQLTDAVNLGQLNSASSSTLNQANAYTDQKLGNVRADSNAGTASAMAMAGLPQAVIPGKGMVAIAGGTYSGQSAAALGVSALSRSGKWAYKATASTSTRGSYGVTAGAGFHW
ncbi:YadA-like family protein [Paraburkholderia sediminicola]|uniref:YadA family autotransporter adhesin n=1 Tax=Paraburkholderia sediminicola TaxID=458836 RepID=UPI0038BBA503